MKRVCGLAVALLLGLASLLPAEPPKQGRELTAEEQKEAARLRAEVYRRLGKEDFEGAVRAAKEVADYRAERQGTSHWQVTNARRFVRRWQRLTAVARQDRAEMVRALKAGGDGYQFQQRRRYPEAEAKLHEALALRRKVLGEQHPETADAYHSLALCLGIQGKHDEAAALLRKALVIDRKVLGERHPDTADVSSTLAECLNSQGKQDEALPLFQKVLDVRLEALGERHPATAQAYNNLAVCLARHGQHDRALSLARKALATYRLLLGEQHPETARSYNNVAGCLSRQGRYAEALPLFQKALAVYRMVLGEQHPDTAAGYNNLANCLSHQGRQAEAVLLYHKALTIKLRVRGAQHPDTALSFNGLAACLNEQGRHAEALPLFEKSLAINRVVLGERHPHTTAAYNNVAMCLLEMGRHAEALPLFRKALAAYRLSPGERHSLTALAYNNVALCLDRQGQHAEALPLFQKSLAINRAVLGERHPTIATAYNNVAMCLFNQASYAEALPLYRQALTIYHTARGEQHPDTAHCYNNVAMCLFELGKSAEAVRSWEKALAGSEWGRLQASRTGFDRSLHNVGFISPRSALAACLVRLGKPLEAWQHVEADLARGLLDDLLLTDRSSAGTDVDRRARLQRIDQALFPLLTLEKPDAGQVRQREALTGERDTLLGELAAGAARRLRARVLALPRIQKQLPADAALVFWLDVRDEHLGCVLRHEGPPAWVKLPGSGKGNTWTDADRSLPGRALTALAGGPGHADGRRLLAQLRRQRIAPLQGHLKGVRRLFVVAAGQMSAVPVEVLTEGYTVSYVSSASVFARWAEKHRPLQASSLLVLADPAFQRTAPELPAAPRHGLLILALAPRSLAVRIGLRPGDVLLEYNGKKLTTPADLEPTGGGERVPLRFWREGRTLAGRIPAGRLGVVVDKRSVAEALAAWRKQEKELLVLGRGGDWQPLPGTRLEASALAALIPRTTALLGSDASQRKLAELAAADRLKDFRLLHLATHGQANASLPRDTALILAQDQIDDAAAATRPGRRPLDGRLTVGDVLAAWKLDADLVVLSACQTGLGTEAGGEGMLGFTQALLQKGARSVVLTRWRVDDAATALLMARFYENLLGKRKATKPLGRAAALAEAKTWLRGLSRAEATKRLAALVGGVPRGERGSIKAALPTRRPDAPRGEDHPFAAPYYWAAFVLIGDPD